MFTMRPVGVGRSPYQESAAIPKGPGAQHEAEGLLEILPELERGLHTWYVWPRVADGYGPAIGRSSFVLRGRR
jgi:hypothetical protein